MTIENYQLWPFEPNWSSPVTESLAWLCDVMTSPTGSEQRRSLRFFPRRAFEFEIATYDAERTFYDNLMITFGARAWYLPIWHDVNFIEQSASSGATLLACGSALSSKLRADGVACIIGDTVYDYELVEIDAVTITGVTLKSGTARAWPKGSRVFAVSRARLSGQPEPVKMNDRLITAQVKFEVVEAAPDDGSSIVGDTGLTDTYRNFAVLSTPPDERENLTSGMERMLAELDNQTSLPLWQDTASRPFTYEQFGWVLEGRQELSRFEAFLQMLRGRTIPIWVPTFMEDFKVRTAIRATDRSLAVERAGFTLAGGPRRDREDIMIETIAGQRIYRRITASALNSAGQETLALDAPIGVTIPLNQIVRVSFITLMRLNQDTVEIRHETDSDGVSTVLATFRSAPDSRIPAPANF